jgi:ABC-type dipeptide/oligopeptide/nickel transport system ATPase component
MTTDQITITNIGPIENVSIPAPLPGKIIVLLGRNGTGKTTALQHVSRAVDKGDKMKGNLRDGQVSGAVQVFGATLTVTSSTKRKGDLQVETLDGKFNISDLIDPQIQDPAAADASRIKALVTMANVLPCPDLFWHLVGGRDVFEKIVGKTAIESKDLVTMAERIKRDFETEARREEDRASLAEGRGLGAKNAASGVDTSAESDATVLGEALKQAIQRESRLQAEQRAAEQARDAVQLARDQLADAEADYMGPTVAEALEREVTAKSRTEASERIVQELEMALQDARRILQLDCQALANAISNRKSAESHEAAMQTWRQQLDAVLPAEPSPEELADATEQVKACNLASDQGAVIRRAKEQLAEAEKHLATANDHRKRALILRDAAKGTDDVLSDIVARSGSALRVEGGRLTLDTDKRGKTFFHELSAGERARISVDIGIASMPSTKNGFIILKQEIWEGLDPLNRAALREHIAQKPVGILTAANSAHDVITPTEFA